MGTLHEDPACVSVHRNDWVVSSQPCLGYCGYLENPHMGNPQPAA